MAGPLALVGGGEFREGCTFDAGLLEASGASEVLIVPTAAAYEHPQRLVTLGTSWFDQLGVPACQMRRSKKTAVPGLAKTGMAPGSWPSPLAGLSI